MSLTSRSAGPAAETALLLLLLAGVRRSPLRPAGTAAVAAALLGERTVLTAAKKSVHRSRPPGRYRPRQSPDPGSSGFPSAHASFAFFTATVLSTGGSRTLPWALAGLVVLARLQEGVHRPSDLAAGAALGATTGRIAGLLGPWSDQEAARVGRGPDGSQDSEPEPGVVAEATPAA